MVAQADAPTYAAIDLGASSVRMFTGRLRDGAIELRERLRTPNPRYACPTGCTGMSCICSPRPSDRFRPRVRCTAWASTRGA